MTLQRLGNEVGTFSLFLPILASMFGYCRVSIANFLGITVALYARYVMVGNKKPWKKDGKEGARTMWTEYLGMLRTVVAEIDSSLVQCPAWPVVTDPLFITIFLIILAALAFKRAYKSVVALVSGLAFIIICQSTLMNVVIPDNFGNKLLVFVVGFLVVSAVNVYFLLVRD